MFLNRNSNHLNLIRKVLTCVTTSGMAVFIISCGSGDSSIDDNIPQADGISNITINEGIDVDPSNRNISNITLDLNQSFQTMDGWETYLRMWEEDKINDRFDKSIESYTDLVANHLANNVGINRARLEVWSGLENPVDYWSAFYNGESTYSEWKDFRYQKINDNDDPNIVNPDGFQFARFDYAIEKMLLPLKRAVEANGETLHVNLCYVDFRWTEATLQGNISHANNADEYAEFISVFLNRLKDRYGITADSLEIILEPENTESWRGAQIGQAVVKVAERIRAEGFDTEIIAPSTTAMNRAVPYLTDMSEVPGAIAAVDTFAYHRYGGESADNARSIRTMAEQNGLKTAMLEKVGAGIDQLFEDLTEANVSAWTQYGMAAIVDTSDESAAYNQGANYLVVRDDGNAGPDKILNASKTHELAQVFRFVRMGAKRVNSTTNDSNLDLLAFLNTDDSVAVVVRSKSQARPLGISGLPAGDYVTEFIASGSGEIQKSGVLTHANSETDLLLSMPGEGILTIYTYP